MIDLRPLKKLGAFRNEWLDSRFHFSFADYFDARRMGWGALRVWNDDTIAPGTGFPPHCHRDMEIITYVRHGAITHEDGLGNQGRTASGDVQVMSAGRGITHAEYNRETEDTTLFQIWILTARKSAEPRWEARRFPDRQGEGLVALASGRDEDIARGALLINQDATLYGAHLGAGQVVEHVLGDKRFAYLVPSVGRLRVNGVEVSTRDGLAIAQEEKLVIEAVDDAEVVLVDVP